MIVAFLNDRLILFMVVLTVGFLLDLLLGDPRWLPHPICFIGNMISQGERIIRRIIPKTSRGEFVGGFLLACFIMLISVAIPFALLLLVGKIHILLQAAIEAFMCYQILATRSLKTESMRVYKELQKEDITSARKAVSMIVGRDVEGLNQEGIVKATVETVAENTADGVVAPLIFMAIGGAPLGFLYKSINTMDSMIGYKNEKYMNFGTFAAKLDDVANYLPARVSAILMIVAAAILRLDYKNAYKIFRRDRFNHASPNSAQTESVCAGALQIQLAGDAFYFGKLHKKKTIGDSIRPIEAQDIVKANQLLYGTAILCLVLCLLVMGIII
ncbi:MAG: adenosylcobinamide-phosphate synthase CbiB [Anaerovoracaceae bacterium]|jgi:adenosylcobinamide-phosphate synthase